MQQEASKELTFTQLKKLFEMTLDVKLKRDLVVDWQRVASHKSKKGGWDYVWHCHARMVSREGFEISELEANVCCLPKKLTQAEVKKLFVKQWREGEISYQWQMFSGHEADDALHNKSAYMQSMSENCFSNLLERLRFKDNCKKLKAYDDLSDAELKLKLAILGLW